MKTSKKSIILLFLFSFSLSAAAKDIDAGGGSGGSGRSANLSKEESSFQSWAQVDGSERSFTGYKEKSILFEGTEISIGLFEARKIENSTAYKYKPLDDKTKKFLNSRTLDDRLLRSVKVRVMTRLEDISEIILKDGTVIKSSELINLK